VRFSDVWRLGLLAAVWGASFLFMKVAAPAFGPVVLVELRLGIAAAILVPSLVAGGEGRVLLTHWRPLAILGTVNSAIPFCLLAYAMLHLTGGFASILNATTPFFAAAVAFVWLGARLSRLRVAGLVLGFCGVVVLVWGKASFKQGGSGAAILACLGAASSYGVAASYAKRHVTGLNARAMSAGSLFWGAVVLLPLAIYTLPPTMPGAKPWLNAVALGAMSTAMAYLLYFHLLGSLGPTGAVTVTFLVPAFAMLWGGIFLREAITGPMVVGAVIILVGTGLTTGLVGPRLFGKRRDVSSSVAREAVPDASGRPGG
jgi:drug/metabolite transporter (DMT)-like permease